MKNATSLQTGATIGLPDAPHVPLWLLLGVLWNLFVFEVIARCKGFGAIERWTAPVIIRSRVADDEAVARLHAAVELACTIYPKSARCLQRSSVLSRLLRRQGVKAQLVIGFQRFPFRSHAWVEVDGTAVNEGKRVGEVFRCLDRWGQIE